MTLLNHRFVKMVEMMKAEFIYGKKVHYFSNLESNCHLILRLSDFQVFGSKIFLPMPGRVVTAIRQVNMILFLLRIAKV